MEILLETTNNKDTHHLLNPKEIQCTYHGIQTIFSFHSFVPVVDYIQNPMHLTAYFKKSKALVLKDVEKYLRV